MRDNKWSNDTYFKQNANGFFRYEWFFVEGLYIDTIESVGIVSTDKENPNFYYMQRLYGSKYREFLPDLYRNYTVLTKFNSTFDLIWNRVYKINWIFPYEAPILNDDQSLLFSILYDSEDTKSNSKFIIAKFSEGNGDIESSLRIKFDWDFVIHSLNYRENYLSFLFDQSVQYPYKEQIWQINITNF